MKIFQDECEKDTFQELLQQLKKYNMRALIEKVANRPIPIRTTFEILTEINSRILGHKHPYFFLPDIYKSVKLFSRVRSVCQEVEDSIEKYFSTPIPGTKAYRFSIDLKPSYEPSSTFANGQFSQTDVP
ncbi:hypothetical protein CEXT_35521 [Caerostris extrusa]|uniref:Uncharacterized protein n=1 Tax=Caerostris extrusa TaxID=172846 RepID=A0AAV4UHL9_CAEEX|nr:hypothetical protein CEXT_35521 [Caerostris extrusa]